MENSLERILGWCQENAPDTFAEVLPGATSSELAAAYAATGQWAWPNDVTDFYTRCNGTATYAPQGYLFPDHRPLPLVEVVKRWRDHVKYATGLPIQEVDDPDDPDQNFQFDKLANRLFQEYVTEGGSTEAGDLLPIYIPPWLPIAADSRGIALMVDRRSGPQAGCLFDLELSQNGSGGLWPNLTAMLDDLRSALENGTPVGHFDRYATVTDGVLTWERRQ